MLTLKCQLTYCLLLLAAYLGSEVGAWNLVGGQLKRVFFDGETLMGISPDTSREDNIWVAEKNLGDWPNWHTVPGACEYISSENWNVWCVQSQGVMYYARYTGGSNWADGWTHVQSNVGPMRQVSVYPGEDLIYATTMKKELVAADRDIAGKPNWKIVDTGMHQVRVGVGRASQNLVVVLDTSGAVYIGAEKKREKPDWKFLRRDMLTISFDGNMICGVDLAHSVKFARGPDFTDWKEIEGHDFAMFRTVECYDDKFWALENGNSNIHFIDLKNVANATDPTPCLARGQQCNRPIAPCCNTCLFANPTRNIRCRKHEGDSGAFMFCLPWRCTLTGDGPSKGRSAASTNVTNGYITAEDLSWMTPAELAEERKGAVIAKAEFQKYYAAHLRPRDGKPVPSNI